MRKKLKQKKIKKREGGGRNAAGARKKRRSQRALAFRRNYIFADTGSLLIVSLIRIALPPSTLGSLVKHTPRGIDVARGMRKPHARK